MLLELDAIMQAISAPNNKPAASKVIADTDDFKYLRRFEYGSRSTANPTQVV